MAVPLTAATERDRAGCARRFLALGCASGQGQAGVEAARASDGAHGHGAVSFARSLVHSVFAPARSLSSPCHAVRISAPRRCRRRPQPGAQPGERLPELAGRPAPPPSAAPCSGCAQRTDISCLRGGPKSSHTRWTSLDFGRIRADFSRSWPTAVEFGLWVGLTSPNFGRQFDGTRRVSARNRREVDFKQACPELGLLRATLPLNRPNPEVNKRLPTLARIRLSSTISDQHGPGPTTFGSTSAIYGPTSAKFGLDWHSPGSTNIAPIWPKLARHRPSLVHQRRRNDGDLRLLSEQRSVLRDLEHSSLVCRCGGYPAHRLH